MSVPSTTVSDLCAVAAVLALVDADRTEVQSHYAGPSTHRAYDERQRTIRHVEGGEREVRLPHKDQEKCPVMPQPRESQSDWRRGTVGRVRLFMTWDDDFINAVTQVQSQWEVERQ